MKKIAYLTNQYPMTSHSFIRREIAALERLGYSISRYSVRCTQTELVDADDIAEAHQTKSILSRRFAIVVETLATAVRSPLRWSSAASLAWRAGRGSRAGLVKHLFYFAEACWLASDLRRGGVEHVHVHFGTNSATVMMLAGKVSGIPYSITCHGPEEFDFPVAIGLPEKIRRAAFVVGVSSFGRSQLYRWSAWADWPKAHVVHCGLDGSYFAPRDHAQADWDVSIPRRLVCLGRLCEQKGQLLLIEAAAEMLRRKIPFELILVGDGEMRGEIEKLIVVHGLQDHVTITGWQDGSQVREWLRSSHAMVLPSFAEGLPVAIMESLALHRPVISTYIAGIPELVDSECGWLVPAGNVQALADALADCLTCDQERWSRLGETGAERVRQRHHVDIEAAKLASLF